MQCTRWLRITISLSWKWFVIELSFVKKLLVPRLCQEAIINCANINSQWAGTRGGKYYKIGLEIRPAYCNFKYILYFISNTDQYCRPTTMMYSQSFPYIVMHSSTLYHYALHSSTVEIAYDSACHPLTHLSSNTPVDSFHGLLWSLHTC